MIVHYPCAYIKFSGNTVYYCNGKRTTSFKIDDIESILFQNMTKAVIIGGAMMAEDMNLQDFAINMQFYVSVHWF